MSETENKETEKVTPKDIGKIAIVLVRGKINTKQTIRDTFDMLRLQRKNTCVVVENNPITLGMIKKVKDFITWGEIDDATIHALIEKRGEEYKGPEKSSNGKIAYKKFFVHDGKKYKKYFRLNPPRKGFGRKGIKIPFKVGGALGYRKDKMVDLIQRMI